MYNCGPSFIHLTVNRPREHQNTRHSPQFDLPKYKYQSANFCHHKPKQTQSTQNGRTPTNYRTFSQGAENRLKNLTDDQRGRIVEELLKNATKGVPKRGDIFRVSAVFDVGRKTVGLLWKTAKGQLDRGEKIDVRSRREGRCGRKPKELDAERMILLPQHRRTSMRSLGCGMDLSLSVIFRMIHEGIINAHISAIKPFLTDIHKKKRLEFCLGKLRVHYDLNPVDSGLELSMSLSTPFDHRNSANINSCLQGISAVPNCDLPAEVNLDFDSSSTTTHKYEDFYDCVHIDEKWFYMTKVSEKFYLHKDEKRPHRACKSKRFIMKVMFMAAVARPRFRSDGTVLFDGKIGIFPFTTVEPAKRKSKNRPAGALETKPIQSINKDVIKRCLLDQVLPAVKASWPSGTSRKIFIQQDNARPHLEPEDCEWLAAAKENDWDIELCYQQANSPDLNILDLGFFNAIQTLQHRKNPRTVDDLIRAVKESFYELDAQSLNFVWLTYQQCMTEVMKVRGANSYKVPHVGKLSLLRRGLLPVSLSPDIVDIECAREVLSRMNALGVIEDAEPDRVIPDLNL